MFSNEQVANLGLAKIGSQRVRTLSPPSTSLEKHVAEGFDHWRRDELVKDGRRWTCSIDYAFTLGKTAVHTEREYPNEFLVPPEVLRVLHVEGADDWIASKRSVFRKSDLATFCCVVDIPVSDFDPELVEVVANRVAVECSEFVTQSNRKNDKSEARYQASVEAALRSNALTFGPQSYNHNDGSYPFLSERWG